MSYLKVLILGNYPYHLLTSDLGIRHNPNQGISTWLVNLAHHLAKLPQTDVSVWTQSVGFEDNEVMRKNGVTFHLSHVNGGIRKRMITLFRRDQSAFRMSLKTIHPDIIHAHHTGEYAWLAVNESIPSVLTIHGLYGAVARVLSSNWYSYYGALSILEKLCLNKARNIISISPYITNYVSKYSKGNLYEVENPVNEKYYSCQDKTEPNILLFIAVLSPIKGLLDLIDVISIIKQFYQHILLRVVGFFTPGLEWYQKQVNDMIVKKGLQNNVKILGAKSELEIAEELSRANCLLLTSKQETAPMVISEAMAAGKPVVAMDVGGIKYMVKDGVTGYLIPRGDTQSMAEKVVRILQDETLRKTMGEEARKEAFQRFHPDLVARKTRAVYEEILQRS